MYRRENVRNIADGWETVINQPYERRTRLNVSYWQIIIPEKGSIMPELVPYSIADRRLCGRKWSRCFAVITPNFNPSPAKVLSPTTLFRTWWCSRIFREFRFIWDFNIDWAYVEQTKPDVALFQTIERFLSRVLPPIR
jgi:hypothetical protein